MNKPIEAQVVQAVLPPEPFAPMESPVRPKPGHPSPA